MTDVRQVDFADLPAMIALGAKLHAESPRYRGLAYDPGILHRNVEALMEGGGCFCADDDGRIVGYLLGFLGHYLFNGDETFAAEASFYIDKPYRTFPLALKMVREWEAWATEAGACETVLGVSPGLEDDGRVVGLYQRLGYRTDAQTLRKPMR